MERLFTAKICNLVQLPKGLMYQDLKAINETALSRATLFGTTAALPTLLLALLKRAKFVQMNPMIIAPVRHISTAIIFGLMIPVSCLFPQFGKIKKENLQEEFQSLDDNSVLFYHRGL